MSDVEHKFFTLDDFNLRDRTVLVRVDINSPMDPRSGRILDDHRIRRHLETIRDLDKAKVVLLAHQSRPGKDDYTTLDEHAIRLSQLLGKRVEYVDGLFDSHVRTKIRNMKAGDKILLENTRFYAEETALTGEPNWYKHQRTHIVRNLAPLIDFFVHDAFAAAHRAQPSLIGFAEVVPNLAGRVMQKELEDMGRVFREDGHPRIIVLGGTKIDDSMEVAEHMLKHDNIDTVLTTGLMGQVLLMASGIDLGPGSTDFIKREFTDHEELISRGKNMLEQWGERIKMPLDVALNVDGERRNVSLDGLPSEHTIFDIGLETIRDYTRDLRDAKLIIVNGPAGVFEREDFSIGTTELFRAVAHSRGFSIIGGGHSVAVVEKLDIEDEIDHISTGGGSCISFLSGKPMPGVEALERSKNIFGKGPFQSR